jgi:hypothetical protein
MGEDRPTQLDQRPGDAGADALAGAGDDCCAWLNHPA